MHIGERGVAERPAGIHLHVLLLFVNSAGGDADDRCVHHRRAVEHDGLDPTEIGACHRAALDEIRHAATVEVLAGRDAGGVTFGAIPGLLGRRIGGGGVARVRSRRAELRRIAVESYLDGWLNEGRAARELRGRAVHAASTVERDALMTMAEDEQRHADLAREIVTWCFEEEPVGVGRALASVAAQ